MVQSLLWLVEMSDYDFHFSFREGPDLIDNRNKIVQDAKDSKCEYILFIDSDMVFGEDTLDRLMAHNKDIVGTDYSLKQLPRESTVKGQVSKELFKCEGLGLGMVLIKTEVFDKIQEPFKFVYEEEQMTMGEDIWFCQQAIKQGFDVWCDPTIEVKHIGDYQF